MNVKITHQTYSLTCPACREDLNSAPVTPCGACQVPHHSECMTEIGCSSLNCNPGGTRTHRALANVADNPLAQWVAEGNLHRTRYNEGNPEGGDPGTIFLGLSEGGGSSYGNPCSIDAANYAVIASEHLGACCFDQSTPDGCSCTNPEDYTACSFAGTSGGEALFEILGEPCNCADDDETPWACETRAVESLNELESSGYLSDETWQWESHWQEEEWTDYAREDFGKEIAKVLREHWEWSSEVEIELPETLLDRFRYDAMEDTSGYPEFESGGSSWPLDVWSEWVLESKQSHFDCLAYVVREDLRACYPKQLKLSIGELMGLRIITDRTVQTAREFGMLDQLTPALLVREIRQCIGLPLRRAPEEKARRALSYREGLAMLASILEHGILQAGYGDNA